MTNTMGTKNDGWSWNNYWTYGYEAVTPDNSCSPNSGHVFQAFPASLKTAILGQTKPALIPEADLFSYCNGSQPILTNKGEFDVNQNGANAANSIKTFIRQERAAKYIAVWNLLNFYSDAQDWVVCQVLCKRAGSITWPAC